LLSSRSFDLLWIEYELFPWFPAWTEAILSMSDVPFLVDYDDAIFHRYDLHSNTLVRIALGGKIDRVMRLAALVTVGNEYLADHARRAGAKRVEYLPTVIDRERYQAAPQRSHAKFTIGWIGSPMTAPYLCPIIPALAEVCKSGEARVVLVGSGDIHLDDVPCEVRAWSEDAEIADIQSFDVGIMPLPDAPWERGKCGYKAIQYMACGRPVVVSPVGANRQIVEHGVNGFLAATAADWVRSLQVLRDDQALRERMGKAGRMKAEAQYSMQVTAPRLALLLRDTRKGRR
jgi:glycosyltransferase involved in cell wall biosynthesis